MRGVRMVSTLTLILASPVLAQNLENLRADLNAVRGEIASAEQKSATLAGGLVKALVEARVEILKTTSALIEQRVHATEAGAQLSLVVPATKPDETRAAELERELVQKHQQLAEAKREAEQYKAGLVAAMKAANVATIEQTIALLEQAYLIAKYGLASPAPAPAHPSVPTSTGPDSSAEAPGRQIVIPQITNKRLVKQKYEDFVWFDVEWIAASLARPARSIKGALLFHDLFGELKFGINVTIDQPLAPGGRAIEKGIGFEYNQFRDTHRWVVATELKDMLIQFEVKSILYADGQRQDF